MFSFIFGSCVVLFSMFSSLQADNLTHDLLDIVRDCINQDHPINQKDEILQLINSLDCIGSVKESGTDDLREKYVYTQGAVEQVLALAMKHGVIDRLVGIIHTPTPATPLCTQISPLDKELLHRSMRNDFQKMLTVSSRSAIIREYLDQGGLLFIAYPQGGLEKRTTQQQQVYKQELIKYSNLLFDTVLSCEEMESSKVGATYLFKTPSNDVYAFSIQSQQANNPQSLSTWGMWFGSIDNEAINTRVTEIIDYLVAHGGPNTFKLLDSHPQN
jgi:hypothetical protein